MKDLSNTANTLLKSKSLRLTKARQEVLKIFLEKDYALSHGDLEDALPSDFDRVTLYRTLNSFESKGLTHKLMAGDGVAKYALSVGVCSEHDHYHKHMHFHCEKCDNIFCLEDYLVPSFNIPDSFTVKDVEVNIKGICKNCNS